MMHYGSLLIAGLAVLLSLALCVHAQAAPEPKPPAGIDLSRAVIVAPDKQPILPKAVELLQVEIQKRTGIRLETRASRPEGKVPAIVLGVAADLFQGGVKTPQDVAVPEREDGFAIWVDAEADKTPAVYLAGHDPRGALFAAGRLLRTLSMGKGRLTLDPATRIVTAPQDRIRGHQLGYRNINNTIDAWNVEQFEQYIRDLIVFGTNSIELITDFDSLPKESPLMPLPTGEMNVKLANLLASYGMEVWIWHALRGDVSDPEKAKSELERAGVVLSKMPVLDAVFIPGGDPGETPPETLMPFLARFAEVLRRHHPKAELWLSNQGFEDAQNDFFFACLEREKPAWLTGVIFGPWAKINLKEQRARTPQPYRLRTYPDITHNIRCQYPVPGWDRAFAHTLGRESINPRPRAHAHIHNAEVPYSEGFITYSDGVNDDVNKIIWSATGWDPKVPVETILRDFGKYFIGDDYADGIAKGILALEQNWVGPLRESAYIKPTLAHWQSLEQRADESVRSNWRFQQGLFRAYYDAYVLQRLLRESEQEAQAYAELSRAKEIGVEAAVAAARKALAQAGENPAAPELRKRVEELGEALFKSIGMQLSVPKYHASGAERGAVLDFLDNPLNDRPWLEAQFNAILADPGQEARMRRLDTVLTWENPEPGSFYDDLGNSAKEPHLVRTKAWSDDPGFVESPQDEFTGTSPDRYSGSMQDKTSGDVQMPSAENPPRLSWLDQGQTLFRAPLKMRYEGLDPKAEYTLRVTYGGRFRAVLRLVANGQHEIHGPLPAPQPMAPVEFKIPKAATQDGTLDLEWQKVQGRGCQIAEVWLLRQG